MQEKIIAMLKDAYPDLDFSVGTPFYEMVVRPMAFLWAAQKEGVNELLASNNLADVASMSNSDMDRLMTRFLESRKKGSVVSGIARFIFSKRRDYVVQKDTVLSASQNRQYRVIGDIYAPSASLVGDAYNGYIVDVPVESVGIGSAYDIYSGETFSVEEVSINQYLIKSYFPIDGTLGGYTESNEEFLNRVKGNLSSKTLSTYRGIRATLLEKFNISAIVTVGIRDNEMKRDMIDLPTKDGGVRVHRGSMADVYLKLPFRIVDGLSLPLGFPYLYKGKSVVDDPKQLAHLWNTDVNIAKLASQTSGMNYFDDEVIGLRGSRQETLPWLNYSPNVVDTMQSLTSQTSSLDAVQDFLNDQDKESVHSDNMAKQMWPILVRATLRISDTRGDYAGTLAKNLFIDYINTLSPGQYPKTADISAWLRNKGIQVVHTPINMSGHYITDDLQIQEYGIQFYRSPSSSLLQPVEEDSLRFIVTDESQLSLKTCCFYTNDDLVTVEVI